MMMLRRVTKPRLDTIAPNRRTTSATLACGMRSTLDSPKSLHSRAGTVARRMQSRARQPAIDNASHRPILTASIPLYERRAPTYEPPGNRALYERNSMSDSNAQSHEQRIAGVVQRLLNEHSINRVAGIEEDLRQAGLSSLDMVSLVLSVEEEFGLMIPEVSIMPANFRSIRTISELVETLRANQ